MNRASAFSYRCGSCGRCCHDQVITLSPVDLIAIARAAAITTGAARARFTIRRGSILKFRADGGCAALDGARCTIHRGRPLACRLYPLGLERDGQNLRFVRLEPARASAGVYGLDDTVGEFIAAQGVEGRLALNDRYRPLIATLRDRAAHLLDFDAIEPREFWRAAVREALRETNFDLNPLIDALFDADGAGCARAPLDATVAAHVARLAAMAQREARPAVAAAAAVMLAVSLGYAPSEAIAERRA
ncbi:MAG TPA: YkgJ family cysteine cluster protein [Candidatus Binataceae bacterium]|nr:YkgJ family cysteine cluster protein [Candidatus Binataceae bacterium]